MPLRYQRRVETIELMYRVPEDVWLGMSIKSGEWCPVSINHRPARFPRAGFLPAFPSVADAARYAQEHAHLLTRRSGGVLPQPVTCVRYE